MNLSVPVKTWLRRLPALAAVWLVIAGFLAVEFWSEMPRSWSRWFLLLAFGPPLYVLGEAFFGWLFSAAHGRAISQKRFSVTRVAVALPAAIAAFALYWWLSSLLVGT